jgi:hypothetical protein
MEKIKLILKKRLRIKYLGMFWIFLSYKNDLKNFLGREICYTEFYNIILINHIWNLAKDTVLLSVFS